jgi:uncharacterized protein (TIGR02391 family)
VILEHLNRIPEHENHGNVSLSSSCTTGDNLVAYPRDRQDEIAKALSEGWTWLVSEGFLARKPDDSSHAWYFVTRKGKSLKTRQDVSAYRRASTFPRQMLHPLIAAKSEPPFIRGEYEASVFQAFKEVEVAVRAAGEYAEGLYGTRLMWKAFDASHGPLTDPTTPESERKALGQLFAGAIGSYKNPHSHRSVRIEASEAAELLVLASHLMSIVESRKAKRAR